MGSREEILSKIKATREAKNLSIEVTKAPEASGLKVPEGELQAAFKKSLETVNGECYFAPDKSSCEQAIQQFIADNGVTTSIYTSPKLPLELANTQSIASADDLSKIEVGITSCDLLAAQTGTVLLSAKESRRLLGISPIHIVVAKLSQMRATLDEAVKEMADKYKEQMPSQLTLITGPSRTADIEKTLILGAHGPKRLVVFIYQD